MLATAMGGFCGWWGMVIQSVTEGLLCFGEFDLDTRTGELRRNGVLVKLQPQPAKVLVTLASHAGEIVTRQELANQVWGAETFVDFEQGLNFAIRQIRTALDENSEHPKFLETLPKRGYRFIAPVSEGDAVPEISLPLRSITPLPAIAKTSSRSYKLPLLISAVLIMAALGWGYLHYRAPNTGAPQIQSIAVLPLHNLSPDPEQEYFSDGMTDELITELARTGKLRVTSHTSVERYKKTNQSLPQIAQELGVDAVVEGSVMRAGNRIRITAQLIDGHTDRHLWAESYERDLKDVLPLQIEVARDITKQVSSKLLPDSGERLVNAHSVNPDAFEAYFKGRYFFWNKRTEPDLQKALGYFKEAIDKDPNYADAYVGLADCYFYLKVDPRLDPLRSDPPFQAFAARTSLIT